MREYLDRNVLRPWIAVGVVVVLMGVVVLITEVLGRDPLHGFGVASPTDKIITSSVAAVAVVAVLI